MARKNPLNPEAEEAADAALDAALRALCPDADYYPAALGRLMFHVVQIAEGDRHQQQRSIEMLREWIKAGPNARQ